MKTKTFTLIVLFFGLISNYASADLSDEILDYYNKSVITENDLGTLNGYWKIKALLVVNSVFDTVYLQDVITHGEGVSIEISYHENVIPHPIYENETIDKSFYTAMANVKRSTSWSEEFTGYKMVDNKIVFLNKMFEGRIGNLTCGLYSDASSLTKMYCLDMIIGTRGGHLYVLERE